MSYVLGNHFTGSDYTHAVLFGLEVCGAFGSFLELLSLGFFLTLGNLWVLFKIVQKEHLEMV